MLGTLCNYYTTNKNRGGSLSQKEKTIDHAERTVLKGQFSRLGQNFSLKHSKNVLILSAEFEETTVLMFYQRCQCAALQRCLLTEVAVKSRFSHLLSIQAMPSRPCVFNITKKGCYSAAIPKRSVVELCAFYDPWFIPTWPLDFGNGHQTETGLFNTIY